jgi:hypothetical protein
MKKTDFANEDAMRQHCHDLYAQIREARRMFLRVDTRHSKENHILYKGGMQFLDAAMETLTFEE